jgi:ferredoxin like protein
MTRMSINERLAVNKYILDEGHPHIRVNDDICREKCVQKACLFVCPVKVYTLEDGHIIVDSTGCLECGTCKVVCPTDALEWTYPRGGFGIIYRGG